MREVGIKKINKLKAKEDYFALFYIYIKHTLILTLVPVSLFMNVNIDVKAYIY